MRTIVIALVSALILAAVITELSSRLWPGDWVALLVTSAIALFVNGLLNFRLAALAAPAVTALGAAAPAGAAPAAHPESAPPASGRPRASRADARPREPAIAPAPQGDFETGRVKWFNRSKGFGFIVRESGEEIFVHQRSITMGANQRRPALRDGQAVVFQVAMRDKGAQAENVSPAED